MIATKALVLAGLLALAPAAVFAVCFSRRGSLGVSWLMHPGWRPLPTAHLSPAVLLTMQIMC